MNKADLVPKFNSVFDGTPVIARAPGRINIIGEHTDYNEGFVLPAAIQQAAYAAVTERTDGLICLYSEDYHEKFETNLADMKPTQGWQNYILGVVDQIVKKDLKVGGFNLYLTSEVPIGAGLSSSASVECSTAFALNELFDLNISVIELILIAQKAEHEFVGVKCGIMDQFTSVYGKKDHAIRLDCRSLQYEYIPLDLSGYKIVLFNTGVRHSLASGEYNKRRQQCNEGVDLVRRTYPEVKSLRDVTLAMLQQCVAGVDELIYIRCRYVIDENNRLVDACNFLINGDLKSVGEKMFESHYGLSREYEVSCKELDSLVEFVKNKPGVLGARMMGGGFGGCTINLIEQVKVDELSSNIKQAYSQNMNMELETYVVTTDDGASVLQVS